MPRAVAVHDAGWATVVAVLGYRAQRPGRTLVCELVHLRPAGAESTPGPGVDVSDSHDLRTRRTR